MVPDCPSDAPSRLKLSMDYSQLPALEEWLRNFASRCGLSDQSLFSLDLVLTEATTNVMCYSRNTETTGEIEVVCSLQAGHIEVELTDDGPPFDPTAYIPETFPKSLTDAKPGGLGILLMRRYTTSMHYRRELGRNILRMTLPAEQATPLY